MPDAAARNSCTSSAAITCVAVGCGVRVRVRCRGRRRHLANAPDLLSALGPATEGRHARIHVKQREVIPHTVEPHRVPWQYHRAAVAPVRARPVV